MNEKIPVHRERELWGEREYRMALTVWAEPDNPALGDWLDQTAAAGSNTPAHDVIDLIAHHDTLLDGPRAQVAAHIGPRMRTPGVLEGVFDWYQHTPDARFLIPGDPDWPTGLNELGDHRPYGLWTRGDTTPLVAGRRVCIDGARASTAYGDHVAAQLATDLTDHGTTIVTGAAYGIEGAATRAALTTGGHPVVVLASGIDRPYPAGHANLVDRVAQHGVVVSEIPPTLGPTRWRFLARCRLMAAMTDTVVIAEAGYRSGALRTAAHADQLGRIVGTIPGPITSPASAGCHRLLQESDAYCITQASDVIDIM